MKNKKQNKETTKNMQLFLSLGLSDSCGLKTGFVGEGHECK